MTEKKTQILKAALRVVTAYGFKRTSMADIAKEAGISRPAIYQLFRNKDDVFLSGLDMLIKNAFEGANAATSAAKGRKAKVTAYVLTYMGYYHALLVAGPHGQELLDLNNRLGAEKSMGAQKRFIAELNALMGLEAEAEAGQILTYAATGIKYQTKESNLFKSRITTLVDRFVE